jgi:hypothetical protein
VLSPRPEFTIDKLVVMVHPRNGHAKVFAMIDAYLDESGIHDGAKICVIAGYFGRPGKMRRLESAWKRVLDAQGLPMKDFHAKDLLKNRDSYPLLRKLARVISYQKEVFPVSWAIMVDDFKSFSLQQRKFMTGAVLNPVSGRLIGSGCPSKPYFVPFLSVVRLITDATPVGGKAHFTFGLDRPFHGYALDMFSYIAKDAIVDKPSNWKSKERLGNALFPLASETPQLQAADLLVHLTYKLLEDWITTGNRGGNDPKIVKLLELCHRNRRNKGDHVYQTRVALEQMIAQAKMASPKWKDG